MPNDLYKRADDPTAFGGIIRDLPPDPALKDTPPMEQSREIARARAREAGGYRKLTRSTRR